MKLDAYQIMLLSKFDLHYHGDNKAHDVCKELISPTLPDTNAVVEALFDILQMMLYEYVK